MGITLAKHNLNHGRVKLLERLRIKTRRLWTVYLVWLGIALRLAGNL